MAHVHSNKNMEDTEIEALPSFNKDQQELARLGKRQVLKVCTVQNVCISYRHRMNLYICSETLASCLCLDLVLQSC